MYGWKFLKELRDKNKFFFKLIVCGFNFVCLEIDKIYNMNRYILYFDIMNFVGFNYYYIVVWIIL